MRTVFSGQKPFLPLQWNFYFKYILTIKLYFVIQEDKLKRQKIHVLHFKIPGSTKLQPFPFIS